MYICPSLSLLSLPTTILSVLLSTGAVLAYSTVYITFVKGQGAIGASGQLISMCLLPIESVLIRAGLTVITNGDTL